MPIFKKTQKLDDDFSSFDFDDSLGMPGSSSKESDKALKKRHPILKVGGDVSKGSFNYVTSEAFIRQAVKRGLPKGYDVAYDRFDDLKGTTSSLYSSLTTEWGKTKPAVQSAVRKLLPSFGHAIPRPIRERLERFAATSEELQSENRDDAQLRAAMAEIEAISMQKQSKDRAEDKAEAVLRDEKTDRRFALSLKALSSIDMRMATQNAYSDHIVTKYQKRSLELQYRQYFTLRDTQKLLAEELSKSRALMEAMVHNTALPDAVKMKMTDRVGNSIRNRITGAVSNGAFEFGRNFFGEMTKRVNNSIEGLFNGVRTAASGADMFGDMLSMGKEMGMDPTTQAAQGVGSMITRAIMGRLAEKFNKGFDPNGPVAQGGARAARFARNLPDWLSDKASKGVDDTSLLGQLANWGLSFVPQKTRNTVVGQSNIMSGDEAGLFSKRFQRSIEEVMPEYLSRILHEVSMIRQGKNVDDGNRLVYNDEKNRFTVLKEKNEGAAARVLNSSSAQFARSRITEVADRLTAGKTLSPGARRGLESVLARKAAHNEPLNLAGLLRRGGLEGAEPALQEEIRQAIRGVARGSNGKNDQNRVRELEENFDSVRSAMPNLQSMLSGLMDTGNHEFLRGRGWVEQKGDSFVLNEGRLLGEILAQAPMGPARPSPFSRDGGGGPGSFGGGGGEQTLFSRLFTGTDDLYKPDNRNTPVLDKRKIASGKLTNASTGRPIRTMMDLAGGVMEDGKLLFTPEAISKLVLKDGTSLDAHIASLSAGQRHTATGSVLDRTMARAAEKTDAFVANRGIPTWRRGKRYARDAAGRFVSWSTGRRERLNERFNAVDAAVAGKLDAFQTEGTEENDQLKHATETVTNAAEAVKAKVDQARKSTEPFRTKVSEKLKAGWKRAVAAPAHAVDLYKQGQLIPTIKAEALKAGEYISAKTGKVIKDLRDIADGVMTKGGEWVANPQEVVDELRTKSGELYIKVMDKVEAAVDRATQTRAGATVAAAATTVRDVVSNAVSPLAASVMGAASSAKDRVAASGMAADLTSRVSSAFDAAKDQVAEAARKAKETLQHAQEHDDLMQLLDGFMSGTFSRLDVLASTTSGGSPVIPMATVVAGAPKRGLIRRAAGGLLHGAWAATKWSATKYWQGIGALARGAWHVGAGIVKAPFRMGAATTRQHNHLGKEAADVFIRGERKPILTVGGMQQGIYYNVDAKGKPTTVIRSPKDIEGRVVQIVPDDAGVSMPQTLISEEDVSKLTDYKGHSLLGGTLHGLGKLLSPIASGVGVFYGGAFRLAGWAIGGIASAIKGAATRKKTVQDVYVAGDPVKPRLLAIKMRTGDYISMKHPRKHVRSVEDIDGPVLDTQDAGNQALTQEDINKGIVDVGGKPFKLEGRSLIGGLARSAASLGAGVVRGYMGFMGSVLSAGFAVAKLPFRMIGGLANKITGRGSRRTSMYQRMQAKIVADPMTHQLLSQIGTLLDARLPKRKDDRVGSWQDILKQHEAEKAAKDAAAKAGRRGGGPSWMDKLFGFFKKKDKDDDEDDGDDDSVSSTYIDGGDDERHESTRQQRNRLGNRRDAAGNKRGSRARNARAKELRRRRALGYHGGPRTGMGAHVKAPGRLKRLMGRFGGTRVGKLAGRFGGRAGRFLGGVKRIGGRALGGIGAVGGSLLRRVPGAGMLGRIGGAAKFLKGGLLGMAAGYGLDAYAQSHQGTMMGTLAGYGSTAANVAGWATMVPGVGGALMSGAGAVGSAALSGIGAAGGAIASVLTAPVLLGAAAVAAVGALAYFGYKYYSLKKKAPFRKLRMAQYGIDMDKGVWRVDKVQKLEGILAKHVKITGTTASIDAKGVDIAEIEKIFDLRRSWYNPMRWISGKDEGTGQNKDDFFKWLGGRFKTVFLKWIQVAHAVKAGMDMADIDDTLNDAQKTQFLNEVAGIAPATYEDMTSPFSDGNLDANGKVVTANIDAIRATLKKGDDKSTGSGAAATAAGAASLAVAKPGAPGSKPGAAGAVATAAASAAVASAAINNTAGGGNSAKVQLTAANTQSFVGMFLGGKVSAFLALRYKTYGLSDLEDAKVRALFILEQDVLNNVFYDSHGNASYNEDIADFYRKYAGYFGVSVTDAKQQARWYSWFSKRFLPTLLQFATASKHVNKTIDPRDAEDRMSPKSLLSIANLVMAAVYTGKGSASVWTFTDSPFNDKPLNNDSKITEENLNALKNAVKKQELDEEKAASVTKMDNKGISAAANQTQGANGQANKVPPLPPGVEVGSAAAARFAATGSIATPQGAPVSQPGHGTGGDINALPIPSGSGKAAVAPLLQAAGKMTGVDPNLLSTFAGIESSWNPDAQAKGSSAGGLFQFINGTWKAMLAKYASKYGINPATPKTDPRASALMGAEFIKDNQVALAKALGRQPTDTELYAAHFMGPAGAIQLFKSDQNAIAASIAPRAASSNPSIFYPNRQATTVAGVLKILDNKVAKFRKDGSIGNGTAVANAAPATGVSEALNKLHGNVRDAAATDASGSAPPSAGSQSLAALTPPSGGSSPRLQAAPSTTGAFQAATAAVAQDQVAKQQVANTQSRLSTVAQQSQMTDVSTVLNAQLDTQKGILQALQTMLGHTAALPKIADQTASPTADSTASQTSNPNQTGQGSVNSLLNQAAKDFKSIVPMRATKYS